MKWTLIKKSELAELKAKSVKLIEMYHRKYDPKVECKGCKHLITTINEDWLNGGLYELGRYRSYNSFYCKLNNTCKGYTESTEEKCPRE